MHFALLGDHADGLDMSRVLVASGRHEILTYSGPPAGAAMLGRWGIKPKQVRDLEEILADPAIEGVIVASRLDQRPTQLRRALQSERHVLCVFPPDTTPDSAYEAAMIQGDTHRLLLPLLPEALHPGIRHLAELVRTSPSPLGELQLIEIERCAADAVWHGPQEKVQQSSIPGWNVVRALGGEIAEISGFAECEERAVDKLLLLAGRFECGALFQARFLPCQPAPRQRLGAIGSAGQAELLFPTGWPGPAQLRWRDSTGEWREEAWDALDPWPALVDVFEGALTVPPDQSALSWQTAIRSLELDDAARRSVLRRRVSTLEYPEATEEVGFKGTMTLVGCATLWLCLLLLIVSYWFPWIGWVIVPVLVFFLGLQMLRWIVPKSPEQKSVTVPRKRPNKP